MILSFGKSFSLKQRELLCFRLFCLENLIELCCCGLILAMPMGMARIMLTESALILLSPLAGPRAYREI